jgi:DNA-binding CsgD family transcriptional regulator
MSTSQRLRLHDIREIHELIQRISEIGDQPNLWRHIALEELKRILHGNVALTCDIRIPSAGIPQMIDPIDIGWQTEAARQRFGEYVSSGELATDPGTIALLAATRANQMINCTREELVDDGTWYRSPCVSEARRVGDCDDFVTSSMVVGQCSSHGFVIYRPWGDRRFTDRQRKIMKLFRLELTRAMRNAATPQLIIGELPKMSPRLAQALELMLLHLSMKEIAVRLGLSLHTVNDYQKAVYRLFGVHTRAELISRFRPMKRAIRLPEGLI